MVRSALLAETNSRNRTRWIRLNELPFSRVYAYRLIERGDLVSILLKEPGSKKGLRLIDSESLDRYCESLVAKQEEKV